MTDEREKTMPIEPSDAALTVPLGDPAQTMELAVVQDAGPPTQVLPVPVELNQTLLYTEHVGAGVEGGGDVGGDAGVEGGGDVGANVGVDTVALAEPSADPGADAPTMVGGPLAPTQKIEPPQQADVLRQLGPGEYLHFGPGVPVPPAGVSSTGQAGAVWRGEAVAATAAIAVEPKRRRSVLWTWLLPIIVLMGVLAILAWLYVGKPIAVTGATVRTQSSALTCGETATITGTLQTNGESGTVTYQWTRSDGTKSAELQQHFVKGTHQADVSLLWSFSGQGTVQATATLDVLSPNAASASTNFSYICK